MADEKPLYDLANTFWENKGTEWAQNKVWFNLINSRQTSLSAVKALESVVMGAPSNTKDIDTFAAGPFEDFVRNVIEADDSEAAKAILESKYLSPLLPNVVPSNSLDRLIEISKTGHGSKTLDEEKIIKFTKKAIDAYWKFQDSFWAVQEVDKLINEDTQTAIKAIQIIALSAPNKSKLADVATLDLYRLIENIEDQKDADSAKKILSSETLRPLLNHGRTKQIIPALEKLAA
jgi:hypothetical protein